MQVTSWLVGFSAKSLHQVDLTPDIKENFKKPTYIRNKTLNSVKSVKNMVKTRQRIFSTNIHRTYNCTVQIIRNN